MLANGRAVMNEGSPAATVSVGLPCRPRCVIAAHSVAAAEACIHHHAAGLQTTVVHSTDSRVGGTSGFVTSDDCFDKLLSSAYRSSTKGIAASSCETTTSAASASPFLLSPSQGSHISFDSCLSPSSSFFSGKSLKGGGSGSPSVIPPSARCKLAVHDVWVPPVAQSGESTTSSGGGLCVDKTADDIARFLLDGVNVTVLQLRHSDKFSTAAGSPQQQSVGSVPRSPGASSPYVEDYKSHRQHGEVLFRQLLAAVSTRLLDVDNPERCIISPRERLMSNFHATVTMIEFANEEIADLLVGAELQKVSTAGAADAPFATTAPSAREGCTEQDGSFSQPPPPAALSNDSISSGQGATGGAVKWLSDDDDDSRILEETTSSVGSNGRGISPGAASSNVPVFQESWKSTLSKSSPASGSPRPLNPAEAAFGLSKNRLSSSSSRNRSTSTIEKGSSASALKLRSCGSGGLGVFVDGASSLSVADSTDLDRITLAGIARRDEMFLNRGSSGAVSHTVLVLRFQRGTLGDSFVTETELVLADVCVPFVSTGGVGGSAVGAASPLSPGGAFDAYSMRKGTQSSTALIRLIDAIASEPGKGKGQLRATESARTIRASIKRESLLTRYLADRLDGNNVLYCVAQMPGTAAADQQQLPLSFTATLSRLRQIQESFSNVVDASRSTREVTVTSQAIQSDLRRLRQNLRALQAEQQGFGDAFGSDASIAIQNKNALRIVALKKQISAHEDRLGELRQFLSKRKLSFSRLKVKCERQRSLLEALHKELESKSNTANELVHVSKQLEQSRQAHMSLVDKLEDERHNLIETDNQLLHAKTVASLLENDTQRSSLGKVLSEEELAKQKSNFFRQIFVAATMQKKFTREEVPLREAVVRLRAMNQLLQAKLDVKNRNLLREAQFVCELEQQEKSIHSRIIQIMFAEEAYRAMKGPEDVEAGEIVVSTSSSAAELDTLRQELSELDLMVSIFSPEAKEALDRRQSMDERIASILRQIFEYECSLAQAKDELAALAAKESLQSHHVSALDASILTLKSEEDLLVRINDHVAAEVLTVEAEIAQAHAQLNMVMTACGACRLELDMARSAYDALMKEYEVLCDRFSIELPNVPRTSAAILTRAAWNSQQMPV